VKAGANAGMLSANHDFTPEQWQRFNASLDRIYADFAGRVAKDRNLPDGKIDQVARGRVWTGRQAVSVGLADQTGGFHDALAAARALAKLEPNAPVNLEVFPPERSPLERVLKLLGDLDKTAASVRLMARVAEVFSPLVDRVESMTRARELSTPIEVR
jgi:protease-4